MKMFSNILVVVFFITAIFFQISKCIMGYWSIAIYALVVLLSAFAFQRCIKNCAPHYDFPNWWPLSAGNISSQIISEKIVKRDLQAVCLVCNEMGCEKHDRESVVYLQPWDQFLVDSKVNIELEKLLNALLEQHTTWFTDIAHNKEEIMLELKQVIRLVTASLLLRIKNRLKWSDLILKKLPKFLTHHLEMYVYGKRKAKSASFLEESVLLQYGNLLHPALKNASNEAKFLKSFSKLVIHSTLSCKLNKCNVSQAFLSEFLCCCIFSPLIEILIDPDKINTFLIFLLDKNSNSGKSGKEQPASVEKVEFLCNFTAHPTHRKQILRPNHLGIERSQIFEDEHLLFLFSQYAKEEYFLNVLQFMIHINSFMSQIINPDLSDQQLLDLHNFLKNINAQYMLPSSKDYIDFGRSIRDNFALAVSDYFGNLQQFRNSKSLYEAFEFANETLEIYCHKFFHTDIYLKLICGQRSRSFNSNSTEHADLEQDSDAMQYGDTQTSNGDSLTGRRFSGDFSTTSKNLSNWTVSIIRVNPRLDVMGREVFYFEIQVSELSENKEWTIERQFNEFYILAAKLKEFHGDELEDFTLPSKKPLLKVNKSLMESYRYELEYFLRDLLGNAFLQRSELICNFLSSPEFNYNYFSENFNIGKIIKNVPSRFSKERGQHLCNFLRNFITSCEKPSSTSTPLPRQFAWNERRPRKNLSSMSSPSQTDSDLFQLSGQRTATSASVERIYAHLEYFYDYILLVLIRFYRANKWILQLLYMARPLLRQTFQVYCEYWVNRRLQSTLLTPGKMCQLIRDLKRLLTRENNMTNADNSEGDLFNHTIANMTKSQRSQKALHLTKEYIPKWLFDHVLDSSSHEQITFLLFSLLQHRLLNKQLLYLIASSLISELFPELIYQTID